MSSRFTDPFILRAIVANVFLPPKLPNGADDVADWEDALLSHLITALAGFERRVHEEEQSRVQAAQKSLLKLTISRGKDGHIDNPALKNGLEQMSKLKLANRRYTRTSFCRQVLRANSRQLLVLSGHCILRNRMLQYF
jgi:hypothetical protein